MFLDFFLSDIVFIQRILYFNETIVLADVLFVSVKHETKEHVSDQNPQKVKTKLQVSLVSI